MPLPLVKIDLRMVPLRIVLLHWRLCASTTAIMKCSSESCGSLSLSSALHSLRHLISPDSDTHTLLAADSVPGGKPCSTFPDSWGWKLRTCPWKLPGRQSWHGGHLSSCTGGIRYSHQIRRYTRSDISPPLIHCFPPGRCCQGHLRSDCMCLQMSSFAFLSCRHLLVALAVFNVYFHTASIQ